MLIKYFTFIVEFIQKKKKIKAKNTGKNYKE